MLSYVLFLSIGVAYVTANCGECGSVLGHYDALNCVGSGDQPGDCCPIKFECPKIELSPNSCWFNGNTYPIGQEIPTNVTGPCRHCTCLEGFDGGPARVTCANSECFGDRIRGDEECINHYEVNKCCSTDKVCGVDAIAKLKTCNYRGETVKEGQRFYPKNAQCYACVCNEDFVDHQNPWSQPKSCRKLTCNLDDKEDELNNFCAPVYLRDSCCPHEWICPGTEVKIIGDNPSPRPHLSCKFGTTDIPFGHGVQVDKKCVTCNCEKPPYVTCRLDTDCQ